MKDFETEIGDVKQVDFFPQLKIKRWDNEANFSVRLLDGEPDEAVVTTEGGVTKYAKEKIEANFTTDDREEGGSTLEVIFKEKPKTNIINFSLQTKGLNFFYQPALTQEEIDDGTVRPDNVIGSYAVYHKSKAHHVIGQTNYKTGKAFHIYRPKITDADGKFEWCELNIDVNTEIMTVTMPQAFLNIATYPITYR